MSYNKSFEDKWKMARAGKGAEESNVFVRYGEVPKTQRQFNLLHFYDYIHAVAKAHGFKKGLEVGCGRGTIALYLHKYLGMEIFATDISQDSVDLAKRNFALERGKGTIEVADATKLPYANETFDLTTSIGLVEHLEDYRPIFREQYRVLKKGGCMISFNIPKKSSVQSLNKVNRFFRRLSGQKLQKDYFRNSDTPEDYRRSAEEAGFSDVVTFYVNPFPLFTPVGKVGESFWTFVFRGIYAVRSIFMAYPLKGSKLLSQAHYLTAWKK